MKTSVLDASALLAMFFGEPGMEKMRGLFQKAADTNHPALISAANWAEVIYRIERKQGSRGVEIARQFEGTMPLDVSPLDREMAESAAHLKNQYGLDLADAFAGALAKNKNAELVTADYEFKALEREIKINWLK